jgi:hypothetical protein
LQKQKPRALEAGGVSESGDGLAAISAFGSSLGLESGFFGLARAATGSSGSLGRIARFGRSNLLGCIAGFSGGNLLAGVASLGGFGAIFAGLSDAGKSSECEQNDSLFHIFITLNGYVVRMSISMDQSNSKDLVWKGSVTTEAFSR